MVYLFLRKLDVYIRQLQVRMNPGRFGRGLFWPGRFGRVVSAWVVLAWVVSALFWGESIRPILVGRFGHKLFQPWVVSASLNIGAKSTYFCSLFVLNKYSLTF